MPDLSEQLCSSDVPIIAVAPLIGGRAIKGPTVKLMQELGMRADVVGVYEFYTDRCADLLDAMLIDTADGQQARKIGCVVACTDTLMQTMADRLRVAQSVLELSVKGGRP
jgi:LPPG:FO 2-phospho-L-lactate transferase